ESAAPCLGECRFSLHALAAPAADQAETRESRAENGKAAGSGTRVEINPILVFTVCAPNCRAGATVSARNSSSRSREAGCDGIVYGDHIIGRGAELFGPYPGNRGRGDRLEAARECRAPKVFRTCSMRSRYRACGAGGASTILMERARAARA